MNHGNEEESGWDVLASQLGLEPAPQPAPSHALPSPVEKKAPEPPAPPVKQVVREEVAEVIPARVTEIEMKITGVADVAEPTLFGEGVVEDSVDVLDDEAPEELESAGEEERSEGEGKGRRRRRRRRRKKGGPEVPVAEGATVAESATIAEVEETPEANLLAFPIAEDEEAAEDEVLAEFGGEAATEFDEEDDDEEEIEEIIPEVGAIEEDESTEPLPEWKVTAWTDLVGTLYRPQDR